MQNTYDKKWFWGPWEYYVYLVIEIFYETTWKWTMYFKYFNLWAFDVLLSLCHDICDYPVYVTTRLCDDLVMWPWVRFLDLKWYWIFYGSQWIICSFIVNLGSLVLQYVYHSCHDVKEIYFAEFKWKFTNFSMSIKCSLS